MIGVATAIGAPWRGLFKIHFDLLDPSKYTLGKMANLTPWNLGFSRASAATVQTSASTVDTTPTTDQPRFGNTGTTRGLEFEEQRTNTQIHCRQESFATSAAGASSTINAGAVTGPDGATLVDTVTWSNTSAGWRFLSGVNTTGAGYTASVWMLGVSGPQKTQLLYPGSTDSSGITSYVPVSTWARTPGWGLSGSSQAGYCEIRDNGAFTSAPYTVAYDLIQLEHGSFPTSSIITTTAAATRNGERLYCANGAGLVDNGAFGFYAKLQPKGTATQYGANMRLYTIDSNNYGEISATTQKISVVQGGVAYTPATAMTWTANSTIEVQVTGVSASTNTVCKYRVNGGATTTLGTSGAPQGAYAPGGGAIDLLCNGTNNQFTSWVQFIGALRTGRAIL